MFCSSFPSRARNFITPLLFLLFTLFPRIAPSLVPCGSADSCASCISRRSCGWCWDNGECREGIKSGPLYGECGGASVGFRGSSEWGFDSCRDDPCEARHDCSACMQLAHCGWCTSPTSLGAPGSCRSSRRDCAAGDWIHASGAFAGSARANSSCRSAAAAAASNVSHEAAEAEASAAVRNGPPKPIEVAVLLRGAAEGFSIEKQHAVGEVIAEEFGLADGKKVAVESKWSRPADTGGHDVELLVRLPPDAALSLGAGHAGHVGEFGGGVEGAKELLRSKVRSGELQAAFAAAHLPYVPHVYATPWGHIPKSVVKALPSPLPELTLFLDPLSKFMAGFSEESVAEGEEEGEGEDGDEVEGEGEGADEEEEEAGAEVEEEEEEEEMTEAEEEEDEREEGDALLNATPGSDEPPSASAITDAEAAEVAREVSTGAGDSASTTTEFRFAKHNGTLQQNTVAKAARRAAAAATSRRRRRKRGRRSGESENAGGKTASSQKRAQETEVLEFLLQNFTEKQRTLSEAGASESELNTLAANYGRLTACIRSGRGVEQCLTATRK